MRKDLKGYIGISLVGALMSLGVYAKYQEDIKSARLGYINEEHYKSLEVARRTKDVFQTLYEGLRIIAGLPGVKTIDRYAQNLDYNAESAIQQIYKSIASITALSEIYIVPLDFNPERIDQFTGKPEEPIIMFDGLIVGKTALGSQKEPEIKRRDPDQVEEVEAHEYRLLAKQLAWMKANFSLEQVDSAVPAVTGPEVITCDNTRFHPLHPDDKDRSGLVYSLPLYNLQGRLKGSVSGIILSSVLSDHLPSGNYVLGNRKYGYTVRKNKADELPTSGEWIKRIRPDPDLIYSEVLSVKIPDTDNAWYLWAGQANQVFEKRSDVVMAKQFAMLGYFSCFFITIAAFLGYFMTRRHSNHLELINEKLRMHQAMLERSRGIVKRFSGKMLSIREEEKKRLGRDLHDMVGSMAVALNARLAITESEIKNVNTPGALNNIRQTKKLVDLVVQDFKKIAVNLRPPQLETAGLSGALREYCREAARHANLQIDLNIDVKDDNISGELAIALYRVVQESLSNVVKHARGRKVFIRLCEENKRIFLEIRDNGVGFDPVAVETHSQNFKMGILGMSERVESFGGEFAVESRPGKGTGIKVSVPLNASLI